MPEAYQAVNEVTPLGGGGVGWRLPGGCHVSKNPCSRPALVATVYGATGGLLGATVSLTVNNALFEISAVPYFAIVIGLVLMMLGATMGQRAVQEDYEDRRTRMVKGGWAAVVLVAGMSCFLLERHWNSVTTPAFKTPIYMVLGAALSFTVSISLVDLIHIVATCCVQLAPNFAPPLMDSPRQMVAGFAGAVAMGAVFGLIFGLLNVMQEDGGPHVMMERLRAEQRASLPVGIGMGAALGVILSQLGEEGENTPLAQREYFWGRVARTARESATVHQGSAGL